MPDHVEQDSSPVLPQYVKPGVFASFGSVLVYLFHLLTFGKFRKRLLHFRNEEAVVYSAHRSFYLWALILLGFILKPVLDTNGYWLWPWIWIMAGVYTFLTVLWQLGTKKLAVITLVVLVLYFSGLLHYSHYLRNLHPYMNGSVPLAFSLLLIIPWTVSLIETFRVGKKKFSPNGIEERLIGEGNDVLDRGGFHFVCRYPDILEFILGFGSGTIEARDGSNKVVIAYENVLFLFFRWSAIDEILHQRAAVVDNAEADAVAVEDIHHKPIS